MGESEAQPLFVKFPSIGRHAMAECQDSVWTVQRFGIKVQLWVSPDVPVWTRELISQTEQRRSHW